MNRREFTKSLAAAAAAPALPARAMSMAGPVIPAAMYAKAAHWASMWHLSTIATYRNILGVDDELAKAVFTRLQDDGLLTKTDRLGFAYAARPWYKEAAVAGRLSKALRPEGEEASRRSVRELVEDLIEDEAPADDSPQPVEPSMDTDAEPDGDASV